MTESKMLKSVNECPWCNMGGYKKLYKLDGGVEARRCDSCGIVYSSVVLSEYGLQNYWSNYETQIHMKDDLLSKQRESMYRIEYDYVAKYISTNSDILDVGCSNGDFLDFFSAEQHRCEGVEFGKDAYEQASKKYKVYYGDLVDVDIDKKYDLIIFRGVIQYLLNPKQAFIKAISLLKENGLIFITSSPNADSLCFELFKENFRLPVNETNYYMFSEKILSKFMLENGMKLYASNHLYIDTPYADIENDIVIVAKAIDQRNKGEKISEMAPPFYDNMLTLIYRKTCK